MHNASGLQGSGGSDGGTEKEEEIQRDEGGEVISAGDDWRAASGAENPDAEGVAQGHEA